jgi:sugar lactone lactonase YvrE
VEAERVSRLLWLALVLCRSACPNDGKVDARGRLWVGSKSLKPQPPYQPDAAGVLAPDPGAPPPPGRLLLAGSDGVRVVDAVGAVTVSNGIGFSPSSDTLYYIDSPARIVWAFDLDLASGALSQRRVLADVRAFAPSGAVPDGLAVDAEGCVWVALWDGSCVVRLSAQGELLRRVEMPVSRPTCLAFGPGHRLFVTSCSYDVGDAAPLAAPLAGAIFEIDAGVGGAPIAHCAL